MHIMPVRTTARRNKIMIDKELEKELRKGNAIWDEAIYNARKAFEDTFEKKGIDAAYWTIEITSHKIASDLVSIMETKTWNEERESEDD